MGTSWTWPAVRRRRESSAGHGSITAIADRWVLVLAAVPAACRCYQSRPLLLLSTAGVCAGSHTTYLVALSLTWLRDTADAVGEAELSVPVFDIASVEEVSNRSLSLVRRETTVCDDSRIQRPATRIFTLAPTGPESV